MAFRRPRAPAFALGLALLLPPLAGCDPCESSEDLEILDESGVLDKAGIEALRGVYREFMAWTPSEGICLSRLEIVSDPDEPQGLMQGAFGSASVILDPKSEDWEEELRFSLCLLLDMEAELSSQDPERFPESDETSRHEAFASACQEGPRAWWAETSESACGESGLNATDAWLRESVYTRYPGPRVDGTFEAAWGESLLVEDVFGNKAKRSWGVGSADALLALLFGFPFQAQGSVERVDPVTGDRAEILRFPLTDTARVELLGGSELVVVIQDAGEVELLLLHPETGGFESLRFELDASLEGGVVSDGWVYAKEASIGQAPIHAFALDGGETRQIALPELESPLLSLANGWPIAAPGGFVLGVLDAQVIQESADSVSIMVYRESLQRYHHATDSWEILLDETWTIPAGTSSEGYVLGTLLNRDGPALLGAWDLEEDRLLVSKDLCLRDAWPWDMIGDRPVTYLSDEQENLLVVPIEVVVP